MHPIRLYCAIVEDMHYAEGNTFKLRDCFCLLCAASHFMVTRTNHKAVNKQPLTLIQDQWQIFDKKFHRNTCKMQEESDNKMLCLHWKK